MRRNGQRIKRTKSRGAGRAPGRSGTRARAGSREKAKPAPAEVLDEVLDEVRVRVRELVFLDPATVEPNPENPWFHDEPQRRAFRHMLGTIGFAGAVLVRRLGKRYQLVDGELRLEEFPKGQKIPALVTDLTAAEARTLLATYNAVGQLARVDPERFSALRARLVDFEEMRERFKHVSFFVGDRGGKDGRASAFPEPDVVVTHRCPKCGYRWKGAASSA